MKTLIVIIIILLSPSVFAQQTFYIKNASQFFDIKIDVEKCTDYSCKGKASFSFYKKNGTKPYQVIDLSETYIQLDKNKQSLTNIDGTYDDEPVLNVDDFNFDGMEDIAICNGSNGSYGMPSYNIYLSSRKAHKFVYSKAFSELGRHLVVPQVDKSKKVLRIFDKDGCCWHITEEYSVINNKS